jgi:hypothetical protein
MESISTSKGDSRTLSGHGIRKQVMNQNISFLSFLWNSVGNACFSCNGLCVCGGGRVEGGGGTHGDG